MKKWTIKNAKAYIQGHVRMKLYYSKRWNKLLPLHIFEQIYYRLWAMNKECLSSGSCVECGCSTPALQMADKACDECYPEMMNKESWEIYKTNYRIYFIGGSRDRSNMGMRVERYTFRA